MPEHMARCTAPENLPIFRALHLCAFQQQLVLLLKVLDYFFDGTFVSEAIQSWVPGNNSGSMLVPDILDIAADSKDSLVL